MTTSPCGDLPSDGRLVIDLVGSLACIAGAMIADDSRHRSWSSALDGLARGLADDAERGMERRRRCAQYRRQVTAPTRLILLPAAN